MDFCAFFFAVGRGEHVVSIIFFEIMKIQILLHRNVDMSRNSVDGIDENLFYQIRPILKSRGKILIKQYNKILNKDLNIEE